MTSKVCEKAWLLFLSFITLVWLLFYLSAYMSVASICDACIVHTVTLFASLCRILFGIYNCAAHCYWMVTLLYDSCQWLLALLMYACHCLWLITGRGVFATRSFWPGDFVLEYRGKLLNALPNCISDTYLFEFLHNGKKTWYVLMFMFVHWCSHWA